MRNPKHSFAPLTSLAIGITALALNSCGDSNDGVRVYEVIIPSGNENTSPAAPPEPTTPTPPHTHTHTNPHSDSPSMTWTAPDSWKIIPNANRFDRARYEVGDADGEKAIATVTAGIGGSVPMNVNRWRGQLGLGAASEDELRAAAIPVATPDSNGVIFDISATDGSRKILAAILPIPSDTYFIKLDGPGTIVDAQREAFMEMVNSCKIGESKTSATTAPIAAEPPKLQFAAPAGWTAGTNTGSSSMRTASYTTANEGEVSILLFRASPEAIVQNVNIWRQEAGLDDATSEDQLEFTEVKSTDGKHTWKVHQVNGEQSAVLAAFTTLGDTLWVARLKSTPDNVSKDSSAMTEFLQSASTK